MGVEHEGQGRSCGRCGGCALGRVRPRRTQPRIASVNGVQLTVTGSGSADTITVTLPGDARAPPTVDTAYEITDPGGVAAGAGCVQGTMPDPADDADPNTPPLPPVADPNKALCQRGPAPRPAFNDFQATIDGGGGNDMIRSVAPLTVGDVVSTGRPYVHHGRCG